jgi:hypothetical protein
LKIVKPVPVTQAGTFSRASVGTYFDNNGVLQTAAVDTPRYTYDPSDLTKAPYLLLEAAATNLLPNSGHLAAWTNAGAPYMSTTTGATAAPDGTLSGDLIVNSGGTDFCSFYQAASVTSGNNYVVSLFVKAGTSSRFDVRMISGSTDCYATYALDVSSVVYVQPGAIATKFTNIGGGWYRVELSVTAQSNTLTVYVYPKTQYASSSTGGMYYWGAQLEAGSAATSYIATTSTASARAADSLNGSGLLASSVAENDYAAYSSSTSYTLGQRVIVTSLHKVFESLRGGSSTVTISYASPAVIGWTAHGLPNGTAVTFTTTGTLPTGLTAGTTYYVVNANTDTFNVAATLGGTVINTTSAGSGVHTGHDSANLNNDPSTSPTYWLDCGSTNRWKPFDSVVQSQLTATTNAAFTVNVPQLIDTVALLNTNAQSARVTAYYGSAQVYDTNVSLYTDEVEITDWSLYFFTDFRQQTDIILNDLPPYLNMNVSVSLAAASGNTVAVGAVIYGKAKDISSEKKGVEFGAKIGITDYSVKTKDAFGNYTITPRAFAKRANWDVYVNNEDIDFTFNLLSSIRTTPILFIGSSQYKSTAIYGYYKQWEVSIPYPDVSICTIEIDGLV